MALTVTHPFVVNIADDPKAAAAGEVLPSHWNANHSVSGTLSSTDVTGLPTVRDILTSNRNYYISATGSDSNGGTNSSTDAWATLQHAMNFISANLDIGGFTITINIGAGTFTGVGMKPTTGGGIIQWLGAGSASTIIADGPADGTYNTGETFSFYFPVYASHGINNLTCQFANAEFEGLITCFSSDNVVFLGTADSFFTPVDLAFTLDNNLVAGVLVIFGESFFQIQPFGTLKLNYTPGSATQQIPTFDVELGAVLTVNSRSIVITGTPVFALGGQQPPVFFNANFNGTIRVNAIAYTGSSTGPTYNLSYNSAFSDLNFGFGSGTVGDSFGFCDSSSSWQGIEGPFPTNNTQTADYTLAFTDADMIVEMNATGASTVSVPTNASVPFPVGTKIWITQISTGAASVTAASTVVTVHNSGALSGQWATVKLYQRAANEWVKTNA